jgi:hypothetical protein
MYLKNVLDPKKMYFEFPYNILIERKLEVHFFEKMYLKRTT